MIYIEYFIIFNAINLIAIGLTAALDTVILDCYIIDKYNKLIGAWIKTTLLLIIIMFAMLFGWGLSYLFS